jgi:hypothetical protein
MYHIHLMDSYSRSEDNEKYEASLYSAHDVLEVLGLNREDFVLVAILAGGDYSVSLKLQNCTEV